MTAPSAPAPGVLARRRPASRDTRYQPLVGLMLVAVLAGGCEREARRYQELPAAANRETSVRVSSLEPGMAQPPAEVTSPYQNNAWGMGEGKRLYAAYNCAPCHGVNGGGAIGPAAHRRQVDLRRQGRTDLRDDLPGAAGRHAVVRGTRHHAANLAARGLRAVDVRPGRADLGPLAQRRSDGGPARIAAVEAGARADGPPVMSHIQSILDPAGIQAARVSHLWWVMFWICAAVWVPSRWPRSSRSSADGAETRPPPIRNSDGPWRWRGESASSP